MENLFKDSMSSKSDEELINIVTINRQDYQPSAIKAAEEELNIRNVSVCEIERIKENAIETKIKKSQRENNTVSSGIRLINYLIDNFIWLLLSFIFTFPLNASKDGHMLIGFLIIFVAFFSYYFILEVNFQKTLGKLITKTRVVTYDENKPTALDIFIRTVSRLLPFDNISYLFMRNGIHDITSKTKVIRDK